MNDEKDISITINNQSHHFKSNDIEAMRKLPWSERKLLIELLENIKQAEFVKPVKEPVFEDANFDEPEEPAIDSSIVLSKKITDKNSLKNVRTKTLDSQVKPSDADVDDLMSRLIVEQKQSSSSVPDKSAVYKWLLIVFAVIFGLALIF